jgi:hypothetical protein
MGQVIVEYIFLKQKTMTLVILKNTKERQMYRAISGLLILMMPIMSLGYEGYNICNFGKQSIPSIVCQGPTVMKETKVSGNVNVVGTLNAISVQMGALNVTGRAELYDAEVNGQATVSGSLKATNADFKQNLTVTGDQIVLNHVKIKGSVSVYTKDHTPHISMVCGTVVSQAVEFYGKAGIIEITDDSVIQGKIKNGSMIFIKQKCDG